MALDINNTRVTDQGVISNHIINFYSNLFNPNTFAPFDYAQLDSLPFKVVFYSDRKEMAKEIREAVFGLSEESIPESDGFLGSFFHKTWYIIDFDVINVVQYFFTHTFLSYGLNSNFVTLIPKVKCPSKIEDLRPIVLVNFLFKIFTKVLSNRLGQSLYCFGF